ncbi:hypothetical protein PsYK624_144160 [Phanerochaete sordida]|uniref:Uncharacterized protein n=1 Tax=Phanerochaete sordida TaxID=48140 RepID=A0A9P3GLV5_9APHY|nr:hypothetical protein PsYK624_144160 [Phanerochaete sordida]
MDTLPHVRQLEVIPLNPLRLSKFDANTSASGSPKRPLPEVFSYGKLRRPRTILWLPALGVALGCFGIVAGMLLWLLTRRVRDHIPSEDSQFRRALVALEGSPSATATDADGTINLNATLYGLTIATIAASSKLVSFATPIVVGVFALRLASSWVSVHPRSQLQALPTAAQYGLVMKLCSSPSLMNLLGVGSYVRQGEKRRAHVAPLLSTATVVVCVLLALSYALSVVDIWLHSTSSAFIHTLVDDLVPDTLPALGSQVNLTVCPGPAETVRQAFPGSSPSNYTNCQHFATQSVSAVVHRWGDAALMDEGQATLRNQSSRFQSTMVNKYAVLVSVSQPSGVANVTFDTLGVATECQPVTNCALDDVEEYPETIVYCPSFSPPLNISSLSYQSNVQPYNLSGNVLAGPDTGLALSGGAGYGLDSNLNPYGALVVLFWDAPSDTVTFPEGATGWYHVVRGDDTDDRYFYIAGCSVSAYNVSLAYSAGGTMGSSSNPSYTITSDPIRSNFNTTSALLAALDDTYQQTLVSYIQTTLTPSLNVSEEAFNSILSGNMSYAMLALASPLLMAQNSTAGLVLSQRVASRYPLAPLCILIALVGTYGLVALALAALAVFSPSHEMVVHGADTRRTQAELVQLRLTDPLVAVAEQFAGPERQGVLFEVSALEMFREHPRSERVHFEASASGVDGSRGTLGLFKRWNTSDSCTES